MLFGGDGPTHVGCADRAGDVVVSRGDVGVWAEVVERRFEAIALFFVDVFLNQMQRHVSDVFIANSLLFHKLFYFAQPAPYPRVVTGRRLLLLPTIPIEQIIRSR